MCHPDRPILPSLHSGMVKLPNESVLRHVVDVHCHPTDGPMPPDVIKNLQVTLCAMSCMQPDQQLIRDLATANPAKVIPCFGYHPWFSHFISTRPIISKDDHYRNLFLSTSSPPDHVDAYRKLLPLLPDPIALDEILIDLRRDMEAFPEAMLGEVGLDRIFRVPFDYYASPRQRTPFVIPFEHQLTIIEAQMDLAVSLGRNISLHSVKCPSGTVDLLERMRNKHSDKWNRISFDIHSCSLSPEVWRDIEKRHKNAFLSLSIVINSRSSNYKALITSCSPNRLLVESDYDDVSMCTEKTWEMLKKVAEIKGWDLEEEWIVDLDERNWGAVRKLEENWLRFRRGHHEN